MRFFLYALAALPGPALAADQFDLVCSTQGAPTRYRVDLTRNEACSGSCDRIWTMGEASSGELRLIHNPPKAPGDLDERATVNRLTGDYRYYNHIPGLGARMKTGKCEVAPFSGFPAAKF